MFEQILCPVNLKENFSAIQDLCQMGANLGASRAIILHVTNSGVPRSHLEQKMQALLDSLKDIPLETSSVLKEGHPATEIVEFSLNSACESIFLPWRRKNKIRHTLLGSTSEDIVRLAKQPILIHKPKQTNGIENNTFSHLLYATDFSATDAPVIEFLQAVSSALSDVTILHVRKQGIDPYEEESIIKEGYSNLQRLAGEIPRGNATVHTSLLSGEPYRQILRQTKNTDADLIILGRIDDKPIRHILGSTAEKVVQKTECSLLIFP